MPTARFPTVHTLKWTSLNVSGGLCTMRSKLGNFEHVGGRGHQFRWRVVMNWLSHQIIARWSQITDCDGQTVFTSIFLLLQVWDPWWVGWRLPWSERVCTVEYSSLRTKQCGISSWPTMTQTVRVPRRATLNSGTIGSFFNNCIYTCKTFGIKWLEDLLCWI